MTKKSDLNNIVKKYQDARNDLDELSIQYYYNQILKIYNPFSFKNVWWKKYAWVYEFDAEEFDGDYKAKFIECINKYSPDSTKITLNSYCYSAMEKMYGGIIKKINTAKRNPSQVCPLCNKDTPNISSHLREEHKEIVWDKLIELGMVEEKGFEDGCPFCPKHLPKKKCQTDDKVKIIDHIAKYHSTILFDKFKDMFPNTYIGNNHVKNMSEYNIGTNEDFDIMDFIDNNSSYAEEVNMVSDVNQAVSLESFLDIDRSDTEQLILDFILDANINSINGPSFNHKRINTWLQKEKGIDFESTPKLSKKDFDLAIRKLQDQMIMSGLVV